MVLRTERRERSSRGYAHPYNSKIATQRQFGTWAQTIMITTRMGTLRNIPTTPQIARNPRPRMIAKGLMFQ